MGFEVFEKGSAPAPTVPSVTIQKRGLFSLNDAAYRLIGEPEAVQFLWDSQRRLIGIRGVPLSAPNAYPARRQNPAKESRRNRGPILAAGTMFTKYIELDTSTAKRWNPTLEDDMLVIDLKEPGQTVIANRDRSKRGTSAPGE